MTDGVIVTVGWTVKPQSAEAFVAALQGMFPVTRLRPGFRDIRLVKGETDPNQFLLIETWDAAQNFRDYMQFRTETGDAAALMAMLDGMPQITIWGGELLAQAKA